MDFQEITNFDNLYKSMKKCQRGVGWKPSVKDFTLNGIEQCIKMEEQIHSKKWKNGKTKSVLITYPKRREGLSIPFRDRIFQRSINDNILYPKVTNSFIYDNAACQKGKGTNFARQRIKKHLWNYFMKYGNNGYVLQIDIKKYYFNLQHSIVKNKLSDFISGEIYQNVCKILDDQYKTQVGYNPGSQMIQIAGIMFLNKIDHFIKEQLHQKYYIRYMDDMWILNNNKDKLKKDLIQIQKKLNQIDLHIHPNKTKIIKLENGFSFLGFNYKITETGKVIMILNGQNIKHQKYKLRKMIKKPVSKEKIQEYYNSWKAHANNGNSYKLLQKMDNYLSLLIQEAEKNNDKSNKKSSSYQGK